MIARWKDKVNVVKAVVIFFKVRKLANINYIGLMRETKSLNLAPGLNILENNFFIEALLNIVLK